MKKSLLIILMAFVIAGCCTKSSTKFTQPSYERQYEQLCEKIKEKYFIQCPNCLYYKSHDNDDRYEGPDPSLEPFIDHNGKLCGRYRYVADFDNDDLDDVALMDEGVPEFYHSGEGFTLYLQTTNGIYREAGDFFIYPTVGALDIEHSIKGWGFASSRLWIYTKKMISVYEIEDGKFSKKGKIELYSSPFEDETLFNPINLSQAILAPIRLEYSDSTNALGQAVWVLEDEYIPPKNENENPSNGENNK